MNNSEETKAHLKLARLVIRLGVLVFVFSILWLLQNSLYPTIFEASTEIVRIDSTAIEEEYVPIRTLDSTDVENGIHLPTGLIVDVGCQEVMTTCGACHSLDLVTQNRATRDGWKDIIVWMQETQKLWDLGPQEDVILDYLAKNYAPENSGRRKNLTNIEWYPLN
jgi:hypothetical protein